MMTQSQKTSLDPDPYSFNTDPDTDPGLQGSKRTSDTKGRKTKKATAFNMFQNSRNLLSFQLQSPDRIRVLTKSGSTSLLLTFAGDFFYVRIENIRFFTKAPLYHKTFLMTMPFFYKNNDTESLLECLRNSKGRIRSVRPTRRTPTVLLLFTL